MIRIDLAVLDKIPADPQSECGSGSISNETDQKCYSLHFFLPTTVHFNWYRIHSSVNLPFKVKVEILISIVRNPETKDTDKVFTALMMTAIPWKASAHI